MRHVLTILILFLLLPLICFAQVSVSVMPIEESSVTYSINCPDKTCHMSITIYGKSGNAVSYGSEMEIGEAARFVSSQIVKGSDTVIAMSGITYRSTYNRDEDVYELTRDGARIKNFRTIDDLRKFFADIITKNI